jgi:hypothetical protein
MASAPWLKEEVAEKYLVGFDAGYNQLINQPNPARG